VHWGVWLRGAVTGPVIVVLATYAPPGLDSLRSYVGEEQPPESAISPRTTSV
jgi:hypothetical protein